LNREDHQEARAEEPQVRPSIKRKPFVEPKVSGPVDVLESTNFFQAVTGTTEPVVPG
jgi:hypothetical protein